MEDKSERPNKEKSSPSEQLPLVCPRMPSSRAPNPSLSAPNPSPSSSSTLSPAAKVSLLNMEEYEALRSASDDSKEESWEENWVLSGSRSLHLAISEMRKSATELIEHIWKLQLHKDLPGWRRDNDFLLANHRPVLSSLKGCLTSIFKFHSETLNIWTHLLALVVLLAYYPHLAAEKEGNPLPRHERVPLNIHFMMGALCLFFSTAFHILECHSPSIHELFCRLDHFGIAGLIWGAKLAWIKSSSMNRDPNFDATLILGANIVCVISVMLQFSGLASSPEQRNFRTSWFISSAAVFVLVPMAELIYNHGLFVAIQVARIDLFLASILSILVGSLFYVSHIPERFFPGSCDIFLQGHTILHLFVNCTVFLQVYGFHQSALNRTHWKTANKPIWG